MIYLDTSVALAYLFAEDRRPSDLLWGEALVSSRLLEYEMWTRINRDGSARSHGDAARQLVGRVSFLELSPLVLERALEPFPVRVRTLDALHLASIDLLRSRRIEIEVATYDDRMSEAATRLGMSLYSLVT